ncbi:MAG: hypothetical protein H0T69_16495 [Thermoleophilaceae bacterium]|nr:hypothetical protein [Thermoleophilaceae bacterium]
MLIEGGRASGPTDSVCDPTGQVWDTPGLYVFDGSAFPTASKVNPMVTIEALAHMNARTGGQARVGDLPADEQRLAQCGDQLDAIHARSARTPREGPVPSRPPGGGCRSASTASSRCTRRRRWRTRSTSARP